MPCSCHTCPLSVLKSAASCCVWLPPPKKKGREGGGGWGGYSRDINLSSALHPGSLKASEGCSEELALDGDINLKTGRVGWRSETNDAQTSWRSAKSIQNIKHHNVNQEFEAIVSWPWSRQNWEHLRPRSWFCEMRRGGRVTKKWTIFAKTLY